MRYLLDTHTLLWWLFDDPRLSNVGRQVIRDPANDILVSSASAWEIATKFRLGKLDSARILVQDITGWVQRARFREHAVRIDHAQRAGSFPHPHRDPFDRMIAAQSLLDALPVIGKDEHLDPFGVQRVW